MTDPRELPDWRCTDDSPLNTGSRLRDPDDLKVFDREELDGIEDGQYFDNFSE